MRLLVRNLAGHQIAFVRGFPIDVGQLMAITCTRSEWQIGSLFSNGAGGYGIGIIFYKLVFVRKGIYSGVQKISIKLVSLATILLNYNINYKIIN